MRNDLVPSILRLDGHAVDGEERRSLLARLRAGDNPPRTLELDAITYVQRAEPNRNFVRFADAGLAEFTTTFEGTPFLKDHDRGLDARGGTVRAARLLPNEGAPAMLMTIELVKLWAIESALDGTLDRFSIGWRVLGETMCSACGKRLFDAECYHMPGDPLPDGRRVEAIVTRAEGLEVSAVTVAGVEGTGVQDVRAVLSAGRLEMARPRPMPSSVLAALGLDSGATDTQAIGAAQRLQAELASALAEAERLKVAERETFVDGLIEQAYRDGKLMLKHVDRGGSIVRVPHELEALIRTIAADSRDSALAFVGGLPRVVPVGPFSIGPDPSPRARLDATQRSVNRALGLTDETFLKFNEPDRAADRELGLAPSHRK